MPFGLGNALNKLRAGDLEGMMGQFKNTEFRDGVMAVCALIATADGELEAGERQKTAAYITKEPLLRHFDRNQLKEKFLGYANDILNDEDFGSLDAMDAVIKLKKNPEQARAAIRVGVIVANADGEFEPQEEAKLREICKAVGLNADDLVPSV